MYIPSGLCQYEPSNSTTNLSCRMIMSQSRTRPSSTNLRSSNPISKNLINSNNRSISWMDLGRRLQYGHPLSLNVRLATVACHSWSGSSGHCHQTFFPDVRATLSGVMPPFLVGCHSVATSGKSEAKEFVTETLLPSQKGHPFPAVRSWTFPRHSWSGPSGHNHQACLSDPKETWSGVKLPFLVGCH